MSIGELQGWNADPFGLHQERYFSAGNPTKLVRDGDIESYDEPPASTDSAAEAALVPAGQATSASSTPVATTPVAATSVTAAPVAAASVAPAPVTPVAAAPVATVSADAVPADAVPVAATAPDAVPVAAGPRRRSAGGIFIGTVMIAAAATIAAVAIAGDLFPGRPTGPTMPTPSLAPVAFVTQAAHQAMAQRTFDVTVSGTASYDGQTTSIHGTGEADVAAGAMKTTMEFGTSGRVVTEKEISIGGSIYTSVSVNGVPETLAGGRTWTKITVPGPVQPMSTKGDDILAALATLAKSGTTVQRLGVRDVGTVLCTGYAVTGSLMGTLDVWIDSRDTLRELNLSMRSTISGQVVSMDLTEDLSGFGVPVHITAPPPSQVGSL